MPNECMPKDIMPNSSMPKRDYAKKQYAKRLYAKRQYAKRGLCHIAVCQKGTMPKDIMPNDCMPNDIMPKYRGAIFLTQGLNIRCANAHPAHPAPPPLQFGFISAYLKSLPILFAGPKLSDESEAKLVCQGGIGGLLFVSFCFSG